MSNRKTVLLVANTTWNIYNFRQNIISKFIDEGYKVVVLAPIDEFIQYQENFPTVRHIGLRTLSRDGTNPLKDLLLFLDLRRKYKRINPDIVIHYTHKPNIFGGMAARSLGIKSLAVVTGLGYSFIRRGWINRVIKWAYKVTSSNHEKFIFENQDDRLLFSDLQLIKKEQGISIKGCGVDTRHFSPRDVVRNGKIRFSFIGRILYDKGFVEYAESARLIKQEMPNAEFHVIGEFDESNPSSVQKEELVRYMEEDVIEYHGFTKDVRESISKSDCVVLPSYREAIARSLTEAMSMGIPVIATDVPGCREAVDDKDSGFLVEPKNVESLVEAMRSMANMTGDQRVEMGKKGRLKALKELDDQIIAQRIFDIVSQIV